MTRVTTPTIRFTVAEYEKMVRGRVFEVFGGRRVELINGRIYRVSPQRDPHIFAISKGAETLLNARRKNELIVIQGTLRLDNYNEPDPDLQWFAVPFGTPEAKRPLPLLLIEVSHTTYKRDSGVKLRMYANHDIQDYWIVNTRGERVEVYRKPLNPTGKPADCRYGSIQNYTRGQKITLLNRPEVSIAVDDLLP